MEKKIIKYILTGGRHIQKNRQYDKAIYDLTKALEMTPRGEKNLQFQIYSSRGDAWLSKKAYANAQVSPELVYWHRSEKAPNY